MSPCACSISAVDRAKSFAASPAAICLILATASPSPHAPQASGVLQFDFTGPDQVTLANGRLYAFEISGVL